MPVDIHADNIVTTKGLMKIFHLLQTIEGFGSIGHRRSGQYSLLHVDVKIYWLLLRVIYCYPAFAGIRHDLFLIFGFWHAYHYAHVAVWDEFRMTFLAPAFWELYPEQKLMRRPKMNQSATFFMWLRLAYPSFRDKLIAAMATLKQAALDWQLAFVRAAREGKYIDTKNPHMACYIHLLNLYSLFEFCIPCIQDYACALKSNDWSSFLKCYKRMLLLFLSCSSKGAAEYSRSMLMFDHVLRYWIRLGLPIVELFEWNHTIFSEESGEVALSVLAHSQPPTNRSDLKSTQDYWLLTKQKYMANREGEELPRHKKHRVAGIYIPSFLFLIFHAHLSDFLEIKRLFILFIKAELTFFGQFPSCQKNNKSFDL
jgi:hypothetical protein